MMQISTLAGNLGFGTALITLASEPTQASLQQTVQLAGADTTLGQAVTIISGAIGALGYSVFLYNQVKKAWHHWKEKKDAPKK